MYQTILRFVDSKTIKKTIKMTLDGFFIYFFCKEIKPINPK
ncbi:hypothetical protein FNW21_11525 [Flavobacterium restrictum]|uniref:Phosphoinositide-specific phospholipase C EF-hand-like domain-containing protein n=1 Tax=Flavobacterium restrictum TaxID=2594428 RepID=A0A553DYC1_9FLAO|nr:hypothetical protein FNW21_11525 [Flavobacterium restrictum]